MTPEAAVVVEVFLHVLRLFVQNRKVTLVTRFIETLRFHECNILYDRYRKMYN